MRRANLSLALLVLAGLAAGAQQELAPSTDQGPIAIKPAAPTPNADGVYHLGPGITPPELLNAVPALYPRGAAESDPPHNCTIEAVVGIDGVPTSVHAINPNPGPYEESAVAAVKESRFKPGTLDRNPVPVLVRIRVPFSGLAMALPRVLTRVGRFPDGQPQLRNRMGGQAGYTPPTPIHTASPEYSEDARRKKIQGNVRVSVLVNEEGVPVDPRVEKSLGYGLDEKALEAALQYQFRPAMRDGQPVAVRIMIEESFRLY
jgi:TonB family protein